MCCKEVGPNGGDDLEASIPILVPPFSLYFLATVNKQLSCIVPLCHAVSASEPADHGLNPPKS